MTFEVLKRAARMHATGFAAALSAAAINPEVNVSDKQRFRAIQIATAINSLIPEKKLKGDSHE